MSQSKKRTKRKDKVPALHPVNGFKEEPSSNQSSEVESLIYEAEAAVDKFDYDLAEAKIKEALKIESRNTKCLEMLAGLYIEQLKWSEAQNLLKQCIELSPEIGYSKYFSMGQLCEGKESAKFYEKGIEILEKEFENSENIASNEEKSKDVLRRNLSDAYCSVAELYMTDCCFEDDAENKCFSAIEASIKSDPSNPEAHQCLASFHLVKEQFEDAKNAVEKSLSLWLPHYEALRDGETANEAVDDSNLEHLVPVYDSRIKVSKLLIELEKFYEATKILEGLIEEDDEVAEVWYLLGWSNYIQGDEYKTNAHFYLKKAKEIYVKFQMEEDECLSHINELLEELGSDYPLSEEEQCDGDDCELDLASDSDSDNKMEL